MLSPNNEAVTGFWLEHNDLYSLLKSDFMLLRRRSFMSSFANDISVIDSIRLSTIDDILEFSPFGSSLMIMSMTLANGPIARSNAFCVF